MRLSDGAVGIHKTKKKWLGNTARTCIMSVKIHEKNVDLIILYRNHFIQ